MQNTGKENIIFLFFISVSVMYTHKFNGMSRRGVLWVKLIVSNPY